MPLSKVLMDRYHVAPGRSGHYARTEIVTPEFYQMLGHVTHKAEPHVSSYGSFQPKIKNKSSPFGRHKFTVISSKSSRIAVEAPSGATSKLADNLRSTTEQSLRAPKNGLVRLEVVQT